MIRKNFRTQYLQLYPNSKSYKFCDIIFKIFDQNNDDYLDFNDFFTAVTITLNGSKIDKLTCAFKIYDLKGILFLNNYRKVPLDNNNRKK